MARGFCDMNHLDRCQVGSYGSTKGKQERSLCNNADKRIFLQAAGRSVPALQSLHLGAEQMQDLMPGKPAAKKSSKAKAEARPAVVLPPVLDDDEPFVPPVAFLKRSVALP